MLTLAKMSKKQTSLESFFEKGKDPMMRQPTKRKAAFIRKYQESYLNYGFIAIGNSHSSILLCILCGDQLSNEAMKPSKLLHHMETKYSALKDKPLQFFKRKKKT